MPQRSSKSCHVWCVKMNVVCGSPPQSSYRHHMVATSFVVGRNVQQHRYILTCMRSLRWVSGTYRQQVNAATLPTFAASLAHHEPRDRSSDDKRHATKGIFGIGIKQTCQRIDVAFDAFILRTSSAGVRADRRCRAGHVHLAARLDAGPCARSSRGS